MGRVTPIGVLAAAFGVSAVTLPALALDDTLLLPVHACGNMVDVAGPLGPAAGNGCGNADDTGRAAGRADACAEGGERDSPGVLLPVSLPVYVSGSSVSAAGVGDPSAGDESANGSGDRPEPPCRPWLPEPWVPWVPRAPSVPETDPRPPAPSVPETEEKAPPTAAPDLTDPRATSAALARTGAGLTVPAFLGGTALVLGGAVLLRRFGLGTGDRPAGTVRPRTDRA